MANKKYKLTDGNMWATDGIHDFGQNKTQRTINSEVNSALGGKAPTNHASTATTYGAASTSNYGHVKLSNTTPSMDGTAAVGDSTDVARANHVHPSDTSRVPTSRKVNNKQLSSDITLAASDVGAAPTDHASTATTYGKGTSSNYGHVKISDSLTDTTPAATGGVVPSMKAVSDLNGAINSKLSPVNSVTGKPTSNQTPSFGSTVTISQVSQATTGQISVTDRTIKIPNAVATQSAAGLMSAADKTALDSLHKVFTSVSEIGLTGTPTMAAVAQAMPDGSMFICSNTAVDMTGLTNSSQINVVYIVRVGSARIFALGARAYASVALNNARLYYAAYKSNDNAFIGFVELARAEDYSGLFYSTGTYSVSWPLCFGWVANVGKDVQLYVMLPKRLDKVSTVKITSLNNCYIRSVSGDYVGGGNSNLFSYITETEFAVGEGDKLPILLRNSSGWGATSNTPVDGNLNVTFTLS